MIIDRDGTFLYREVVRFDTVVGHGITQIFEHNSYFEYYVYIKNIMVYANDDN